MENRKHLKNTRVHIGQSGSGLLMALLLSAPFVAATQVHADWTSWRGKDGLGISEEKNWVPEQVSAPPLWEINVGVGWSAVASKGGLIYTMGNKDDEDIVYCLNVGDASEVWTFSYAQEAGNFPGPRATPVIDEGRLYTVSREGLAICFDRMTGQVVWKRDLKKDHDLGIPRWGVSGSPLIVEDKLVLNVGKHGGVLNKMTGETIWMSDGANCGYSTPVIFEQSGEQRLAIGGADHIYGVDLNSGRELWAHHFENRWEINASDPLVYDEKVFVSSVYGTGTALLDLSQEQAQPLWETKDIQIYFCSPIYLDGYVYGSDGHVNKDNECHLLCLNAETGEIAWSVQKGFNSIIIADQKIIALSQSGVISVVEATPDQYREITSHKLFETSRKNPVWTAPVLDNGLLFCRSGSGELVCLDLRKSS